MTTFSCIKTIHDNLLIYFPIQKVTTPIFIDFFRFKLQIRYNFLLKTYFVKYIRVNLYLP